MQPSRREFPLGISAGACILFAFALLILPLRWILAAVIAAAVHELCHGGAVLLLGGKIQGLRIARGGAVLSVSTMTPVRELLCALAGPLGSGALVFLFPWIPRISFCALVHCVYNLFPIYPLDGGRIVQCAARQFFPKHQESICRWAENGGLLLLSAGAIYAAVFLDLGWTPLLVAAVLWIRAKSRNTPCKESHLRLQ